METKIAKTRRNAYVKSIVFGLIGFSFLFLSYFFAFRHSVETPPLPPNDYYKNLKQKQTIEFYLRDHQGSKKLDSIKQIIDSLRKLEWDELVGVSHPWRGSGHINKYYRKQIDESMKKYSKLRDSMEKSERAHFREYQNIIATVDTVNREMLITDAAKKIDPYKLYVKPILIYIIMILGMIANQAYSLIHSRKTGSVSIKSIFYQTFQGAKFWSAVLVSPLIFGYLLYSIDGMDKDLPCYILGFQNGFFWHTIFSKLSK
jgi:hypothetical protein